MTSNRRHPPKRLLTMVVMLTACICSFAQKDLAISSLFDGKIAGDKRAVTTWLSNMKNDKVTISLYRSLSLTDADELSAEIESKVRADGAKAVSKEVNQRGGKITYGFYQLPPGRKSNRYILYMNRPTDGVSRILVIYLESDGSAADIKSLIHSR